jgi:hypothetical protein
MGLSAIAVETDPVYGFGVAQCGREPQGSGITPSCNNQSQESA